MSTTFGIPKEKAKELVDKMLHCFQGHIDEYTAKQCALIAVDYIITSNPHSNPFNTEVYSTMGYWQEVKQEIEQF
jgi:hypothetical protein